MSAIMTLIMPFYINKIYMEHAMENSLNRRWWWWLIYTVQERARVFFDETEGTKSVTKGK